MRTWTTAQGAFRLIDRQAVSKYSTAVGRSPAFTERTPDGVLYENLTLDVLNMPHRFCGSSLIAGFVETQTSPNSAISGGTTRCPNRKNYVLASIIAFYDG
jgi:hypothetical protein